MKSKFVGMPPMTAIMIKISSYVKLSSWMNQNSLQFNTVKLLFLPDTEFWQYWQLRQRELKYKSANITLIY